MLKSQLVSLAFREACESLRGEDSKKSLRVVQGGSGNTLTVRLNDEELLFVDWPKIKILSEKLTTMHVLVRALYLMQIDAAGTITNFGIVLKVRGGVMQCFPVLKDVTIDLEMGKAEYNGFFQTSKQAVDTLNRLNEFLVKAAARYPQIAVNVLYNCLLEDCDNAGHLLPDKVAESAESILGAATALAGRRLWFVNLENCVVAKVVVQDFLRAEHMYVLISQKGVLKPKISKKAPYAVADLVRLLWGVRSEKVSTRYSWKNPKSAELLHQFIEKAKTVDVAGRELIIGEFVKSLPEKAKVALLGKIV